MSEAITLRCGQVWEKKSANRVRRKITDLSEGLVEYRLMGRLLTGSTADFLKWIGEYSAVLTQET